MLKWHFFSIPNGNLYTFVKPKYSNSWYIIKTHYTSIPDLSMLQSKFRVHFSILFHVHSKLSVSIKTIHLREWTFKKWILKASLMFQRKNGVQKRSLFILLTTVFQLGLLFIWTHFQENIDKYCRQLVSLLNI